MQDSIFDVPKNIHYFNFAGMSPLPRRTAEIGSAAVERKSRPWALSTPFNFFEETELARELFAKLIGAEKKDIALIPSATYGITSAVKNLHLNAGDEVVIMAEEFPAIYYPFRRAALESNAELRIVGPRTQTEFDWTSQIIQAINIKTKAVAVSPCHWVDGSTVDLIALRRATRKVGAQLIVDGCQWVGAAPFDVQTVEPDHLIVPTYKWMLGPYSFGFHYVAPEHQDGTPLEEYWASRKNADQFSELVNYPDRYQPGARRFDMGERSNLILLPMAIESLRIILELGVSAISGQIEPVIREIGSSASKLGLDAPLAHERSQHMIGLRRAGGWRSDFAERLAEVGVFVSLRGDCVRLSPHLNVTSEDVTVLMDALNREVRP